MHTYTQTTRDMLRNIHSSLIDDVCTANIGDGDDDAACWPIGRRCLTTAYDDFLPMVCTRYIMLVYLLSLVSRFPVFPFFCFPVFPFSRFHWASQAIPSSQYSYISLLPIYMRTFTYEGPRRSILCSADAAIPS